MPGSWLPSRRVSLCPTPHHCSTPSSLNTCRGMSFDIDLRCEVPNPFESEFLRMERRSISVPIPEPPARSKLKRRTTMMSMTSFPKLISRSCTNDWLTPLGLCGEQSEFQPRRAVSDLYNCGVDAHSGAFKLPTLPLLEESPRPSPPPAIDMSFQRDENQLSYQPGDLNDTQEDRSFGSALSISSHRGKSSIFASEDTERDPDESLLDKLRRYSFMPLLDQTPESIRRATPPMQLWIEPPLALDWERKPSGKEMLRDILRRSVAQSPKPSLSSSSVKRPQGIPKRMSGPGRVLCTEDTTPHMCMDELLTPWSERTFDSFE
ncbi:hypothetical protein F5X99DRAFT_427563 [Biscogniauxia marginata]|nr:hypothetical protein F5X99DRAFT_427563 [Biscogniauxia marginata]